MKQAIIKSYDDKHFADTGERVEAAFENVALRFGKNEVELDLTEEHFQEIADFLAPYFAVGSVVKKKSSGKRQIRRDGPPGDPKPARERSRELRAFADAHGMKDQYWKGTSGMYEFSDNLVKMREADLADSN
jgi:hypothetical protein